VVLIFLDELLFVPLLALAAIVLGHLALWVTLSAEKLVEALGLAGVILGYCSLTSFVTLVVLARRLTPKIEMKMPTILGLFFLYFFAIDSRCVESVRDCRFIYKIVTATLTGFEPVLPP